MSTHTAEDDLAEGRDPVTSGDDPVSRSFIDETTMESGVGGMDTSSEVRPPFSQLLKYFEEQEILQTTVC